MSIREVGRKGKRKEPTAGFKYGRAEANRTM